MAYARSAMTNRRVQFSVGVFNILLGVALAFFIDHYVRDFSLLVNKWYDSYWLPLCLACLTLVFEAVFVRLPAGRLPSAKGDSGSCLDSFRKADHRFRPAEILGFFRGIHTNQPHGSATVFLGQLNCSSGRPIVEPTLLSRPCYQTLLVERQTIERCPEFRRGTSS